MYQVALGRIHADDAYGDRRAGLGHHPVLEALIAVPRVQHRHDRVCFDPVRAAAAFGNLPVIRGFADAVRFDPSERMRKISRKYGGIDHRVWSPGLEDEAGIEDLRHQRSDRR